MTLYHNTLRRGLLDFHIGESVPEIVFDVPKYMAEMAQAGVETITFMTKDAFGASYYNTRIGQKNSKLRTDLLAEAVEEARKHGIRLIAYYNVGLNTHVANANPDYRQRDQQGNAVTKAFDYYDLLCLNSPYRDYVANQLLEIAEHYDVDGFFFDITYVWPTSCHCEYCQRWYKEKYGTPIPVSPQVGTPELRRWQDFQKEMRRRFLEMITERIKSVKPDFLIGWNHAGDLAFGHIEADESADYLTSEFHPPIYLYGSLLAKWNRTLGKPFELMMPSEMGSWGEWTLAPKATLRTAAAIATANGGSISFGHVPIPSGALKGSMQAPIMEAIEEANDWVKARSEWLLHAESVPQIAVLHSIENRRMFEATALANHVDQTLNGVNRILIEGNQHFDVLSERTLLEKLEPYEMLIVPDQAYLSAEQEEKIRRFVERGGLLLASHRTSLYDRQGVRRDNFGLADVMGVDFVDSSRYSVMYAADLDPLHFSSVPAMPILVKGAQTNTLQVRPHQASTVLGTWMEPAMEAKVHRHVYHQHAHPAHRTNHPSVILHRYGKGACVYIPAPLEASFWITGSPWLRNLYLGCLKVLRPEPMLEVQAPFGVEVNVMRQGTRWILHLIQVREEKAAGSKTFIEEILPIYNIQVRIRKKPIRLYTAPDLQELSLIEDKDGAGGQFTIPELELHTMVVMEGME